MRMGIDRVHPVSATGPRPREANSRCWSLTRTGFDGDGDGIGYET
jgi:hypothetical protein